MATTGGAGSTAVYLEAGKRRVFAGALDWPGWGRFGRSEEAALEALAGYAPRYAVVAEGAGIAFPADAGDLVVVERLQGSGQTDFGVPGEVAAADAEPLSAARAARLAALVAASWPVLDRAAAGAPAELRKGPRGGGRDRDAIVEHVLLAEVAYARKLGIRRSVPALGDAEAIATLRADLVAALRAPSDGTPTVPKGWLPRYAARRIAWHVLDHAWEIQDRAEPAG
jgi:hypothetical protein